MAISELIEEISATLQETFGEVPDALRPPAPEVKLSLLSEAIGADLPAELRTLLKLHDGENYRGQCFLLGGSAFLLPCTDIISEYRSLCDLAVIAGRLDIEDPQKTTAVGPVRPSHWRRGWIPFWVSDSPWAIDMDPAPGGTVGQIITVVWDNLEVRREFDSLEDLLGRYLHTLRSGERRFSAALSVEAG